MAESPETDGPVEEGAAVIPMRDLVQVSHLYANGFQIGVSNSDISLVLKLDNEPLHVLHLSYTLAKTLEKKVGDVVRRFENAVGREMLVTEDVDKAFRALAASDDAEEDKE